MARYLAEICAFLAARGHDAGTAGIEAEIERDMATLDRLMSEAPDPLAVLFSEIGIKGFIMSAMIGPHRQYRRSDADQWELRFAGADSGTIRIPALAAGDPVRTTARFRSMIEALRDENIIVAIEPDGDRGAAVRLSWPKAAVTE